MSHLDCECHEWATRIIDNQPVRVNGHHERCLHARGAAEIPPLAERDEVQRLAAENAELRIALDNARSSAATSARAREESHQREVVELRLALLATRLELGRE